MKRSVNKQKQVEITYGVVPSPFGFCVIGILEGSVCHLSFLDRGSNQKAQAAVKETWPKATLTRNNTKIRVYAQYVFGSRNKKRPPIMLKGTSFQMKVWNALMTIPEGEVTSYATIARAIGSPRAARAVGAACGRNPIGVIIPCHRVLASSGKLGGYHWGVKRKEAILAWEAAQSF